MRDIKAFQIKFDNIPIKNEYHIIEYSDIDNITTLKFNFNEMLLSNYEYDFNTFNTFQFSYVLDEEILLDVSFDVYKMDFDGEYWMLYSKQRLMDDDDIRYEWSIRDIKDINETLDKIIEDKDGKTT